MIADSCAMIGSGGSQLAKLILRHRLFPGTLFPGFDFSKIPDTLPSSWFTPRGSPSTPPEENAYSTYRSVNGFVNHCCLLGCRQWLAFQTSNVWTTSLYPGKSRQNGPMMGSLTFCTLGRTHAT